MSIRRQQSTTRHSLGFSEWIGDNSSKLPDEDGDGNTKKYIPRNKLAKYWTYKNVRKVLHDHPEVVALNDIIRRDYLIIFSILVYRNLLRYLQDFIRYTINDSRLPLEQYPAGWPESPELDDVFEEFLEHQWQFCPLEFKSQMLTGQTLDTRRILPITSKTELRDLGDPHPESEIFMVDIDPECNHLFGETKPPVVLKAYLSTDPTLYESEINVFTKIHNSPHKSTGPPDSIIGYYGHFRHNSKYYIVLEYAEYGNLETYFQKTTPPESFENLYHFWQIRCVLTSIRSHQDIKPDNILITDCPKHNPYEATFKIADFGMSHVWQVSGENPTAPGIDKKGNQMYSAPECFTPCDELRVIENRVGSEVDIWSLGCLFSEAAVWTVCGQEGMEDYFRRRQAETQSIPIMSGTEFEGCFHDGTRPLNTVALMHDHILQSKKEWDTITPRIIQMIREFLLQESMGPRKNARDLTNYMGKLLQEARDAARDAGHPLEVIPSSTSPNDSTLAIEGVLSRDGLPSSPPPSPTPTTHKTAMPNQVVSQMRLSSSTPPPRMIQTNDNKLTIDEVLRYRSALKARRPPNHQVADQCKSLENKLKGRDQMFLIDDSRSMMKNHRDDVRKTFIALSYLSKKIDKDEIDLFFTSRPTERQYNRRTSRLANIVDQQFISGIGDETTMEACMSEVMDYIINRKLPNRKEMEYLPGNPFFQYRVRKPHITVFILTDGMWSKAGQATSGVQSVIERLTQEVKDRHLARDFVAIQFIRFGDDPDAIENLRKLDEFGKADGWDIVDTRSHKDDVRHMFIGSIDSSIDNNDEDGDVSASS